MIRESERREMMNRKEQCREWSMNIFCYLWRRMWVRGRADRQTPIVPLSLSLPNPYKIKK